MSFTVTPVGNATVGTVQAMKVTVYDAFGNVSTVYTGTMQVTSSDPSLHGSYTFTANGALKGQTSVKVVASGGGGTGGGGTGGGKKP